MTDPKLPTNPFNSDEDWEEWFKKDRYYQQSLKSSWKEYITNNPLPTSPFMSIKNSYLKIINVITKNAVVATFIMIIALTTVSASAAQLIAPTEYKPSTIASNFLSNKQKDTNPYTALKSDNDNNVAISDKCDLAIKYPKKVQNISIGIQNTPSADITLYTDIPIGQDSKYVTGAQNFFNITFGILPLAIDTHLRFC